MVPLDFTSTRSVTFVTPGFHPQVSRAPQFAKGHWQTYAPLGSVTESILVTTTRIPKAPLTPLSRGYVVIDAPSLAATLAIGFQPLEFCPSPVLHFSVPTDGSPELQYQHLMETVHTLQGMALSVRPPCIPAAPEVPL